MKSLQESILDIDKNVSNLNKRAEYVKEWKLSPEEWVKKHKKEVFGRWTTYIEQDTMWGDPGIKGRQYIIGCNKEIQEFDGGTGYLYCGIIPTGLETPGSRDHWVVCIQIKPDEPTKSNLDQQAYEKPDYQMSTNVIIGKKEAVYYAQRALQIFSIMYEVNPDEMAHIWDNAGALYSGEEGNIGQYELDDLTLDI